MTVLDQRRRIVKRSFSAWGSVFAAIILCLLIFDSKGAPAAQTDPNDAGGRRVALVIGNGAYQTSPLRNPVNDARDISQALRSMGFEVISEIDASKRTMITALDEFARRLKKADVGLFYFAGHGMQIKGANYLIPVDARVSTESDVEFESVDAARVLGKMEEAENQTNIIILDACRDNPFARSFRTGSLGLARMDAPKGSYIAFATAPGSVASDGAGRNGIFTECLLRNIQIPGLKIEDVMKRTRIGVAQATGDVQLPWDSSSLMGDFYFIPAATTASSAPADPAASAPAPAPTETPEPSPASAEPSREVQTASIQPSAVPTGDSSKVIYRETFDRDLASWYNANGVSMENSGGKFLFKTGNTSLFCDSWRTTGPPIKELGVDTFTLEAEVVLVLGNPLGGFGFGITDSNGRGYTLQMNAKRKYKYVLLEPTTGNSTPPTGQWGDTLLVHQERNYRILKESVIIPWTNHSAIKKDGVNTLGLAFRGNRVEILINGQSVAQQEIEPLKASSISMAASTGQTVEFDNIVARLP